MNTNATERPSPAPPPEEHQLPDLLPTRLEAFAPGEGWTPERKRIFLAALAQCGVVRDAARAAGMSRQGAYAFRNRAAGRAFHLAWNAAQQLARRRVSDDLMSRAIHGCVEKVVRDGVVIAERHRFDNRLTMSVLTRLDNQLKASDAESRTTRLIAEEFDEFLDIVCTGDEADAANFVYARDRNSGEPELLERIDHYRRHGAGLPPEEEANAPEDGEEVVGNGADLEEAEVVEEGEIVEQDAILDDDEDLEEDDPLADSLVEALTRTGG